MAKLDPLSIEITVDTAKFDEAIARAKRELSEHKAKMNGLRRKVFGIAHEAWPLILGKGRVPSEVTEACLPDDARAVGSYHDGRTTWIVFESDSFEPVEVGKVMPEIRVIFKEIRAADPSRPLDPR